MNLLQRIFGRSADRPAPEISTAVAEAGDKSQKGQTQRNSKSALGSGSAAADSLTCPYCLSTNFQKRGFRQKKLEKVQLYLCLNCNKSFSANKTKGKHYPLAVMLDAISIYNLGYSLEQTCGIINKRNGTDSKSGGTNLMSGNTGTGTSELKILLQPSTLSSWLAETDKLCRYSRMRPYALKRFRPKDMVVTATLAHRQLYRFRFHRAKCELIIREDFKHRNFGPLAEFLEFVPTETPHQYYQEGMRASESPLTFSKTQMIVRAKQNYATRLCDFVLQSVKDRRSRHEAIQKFMLANDSVTVATEVPVYLKREDLEHLQTQLGFEIFTKSGGNGIQGDILSKDQGNSGSGTPKLITGHIDILQIRNGQIHILDYKPRAEKERPIEQLTLYAMALSRLTGLRMYEFKCAWFDEKDYFEFYPLHVLYKPKKGRRRRKVETDEGVYLVNKIKEKIKSIRPTL